MQRTWQSSEDSCCEDKMELVPASNNEEIECIREMLAICKICTVCLEDHIQVFYSASETWKSGPFWVAGTDQACPLDFTWCSASNKQPFTTRNQKTIRTNNRKNNSCVALDLNTQKTGLVAYKCDQTYKYICKVLKII